MAPTCKNGHPKDGPGYCVICKRACQRRYAKANYTADPFFIELRKAINRQIGRKRRRPADA